MALDAKAIKEEIPDKDIYETSHQRTKDNTHKTPESPENSIHAVAPKSPIIPQLHSSTVGLTCPSRTTNSSPLTNGSSSPPLGLIGASHANIIPDTTQVLSKIKRFLGTLVQFSQDINPDIGERVRALIQSLTTGGLTCDEFKTTLQEATNFPLRPYVLPFLKSHMPMLQRELSNQARIENQTLHQFVRMNEHSIFDYAHNSSDHTEIFLPLDGGSGGGCLSNGNGDKATVGYSSNTFKRRASESFFDCQNGAPDWNDYMQASKRPQHFLMGTNNHNNLFAGPAPVFDYQPSGMAMSRGDNNSHAAANRTERGEVRASAADNAGLRFNRSITDVTVTPANAAGGEEEWKNIYTMLNCISAMVDKTKRAITILQQRSSEPATAAAHATYQDQTINEIKRQNEEKVAEFRQNAEEAVNQVKRQAMIEIQRAVAAAESRAIDMLSQERRKIEKIFAEAPKTVAEDNDSLSPIMQGSAGQNGCWNCGRKANETCSGCNFARYCGAFCQRKDWEHHLKVCGNPRIEQVNAANQKSLPRTATSSTRTTPPIQTLAQPLPLQQQQQQPVLLPAAIPNGNRSDTIK